MSKEVNGEWSKEMLVNVNVNRNMVSCGTNFIHFKLADKRTKNGNSFYGSSEKNLKIYLM